MEAGACEAADLFRNIPHVRINGRELARAPVTQMPSESSGRRIRLVRRSISAHIHDDTWTIAYVPAGDEIRLTSSLPSTSHFLELVSVRWERKTISMFASDLICRGEYV
jgi:hypothetical protein